MKNTNRRANTEHKYDCNKKRYKIKRIRKARGQKRCRQTMGRLRKFVSYHAGNKGVGCSSFKMPLQKEKEAATFCVISWILMLILLPCSISRFGVKTARFQTPLPPPSSSNLRRKCQNQPQQLKPVRNLFSEVRAVSCMLCCAACLFRFEAISTTARNVCFNLFPKGIPHSTPCKEVEFSKFPWIFSPTHCPLQFCFNFTKRYCFFKYLILSLGLFLSALVYQIL